jgi:hypothetical protein
MIFPGIRPKEATGQNVSQFENPPALMGVQGFTVTGKDYLGLDLS